MIAGACGSRERPCKAVRVPWLASGLVGVLRSKVNFSCPEMKIEHNNSHESKPLKKSAHPR